MFLIMPISPFDTHAKNGPIYLLYVSTRKISVTGTVLS